MNRKFTENLSFYIIFSNSLAVVTQVDVHMAEMYDKNQAYS